MGVRLVLKPEFAKNWFAARWNAQHSAADRKPDETGPSIEQTLHIALAAIVIVGWALVYTTLMRGIDRGDLARTAGTATAVSSTAAPGERSRSTPSQAPSIAATPAALRQ